MDLKGKKVTIVGAARSGVAAANLVLQQGGILKITDAKPLADIEASLAGLQNFGDTYKIQKTNFVHVPEIQIESDGHTRAFIEDSDLVVASPGVWRTAEPLTWAREKGIPVMGEIEFAWRFCKAPVIAVTGSNGKTTTVTLITEVLKAAGKNVCLCGNVGTPFAGHVLTPGIDFFVVEISSFQLELVDTFRPHVALLTNFSQNHLDRHPDMQDYFNAKVRLFMNQTSSDLTLLNAQDEWSMKAAGHTRAKVVTFNEKGEVRDPNHAAVLAAARILGVADEVTLKVIDAFRGVEHRREFVRSLDGVDYVNDSKSTTVEAGRWALERAQKPLILIVGGFDKHSDYAPLRDLVQKKVRIMIAMGAIRQQFKDTFHDVVRVDVIDGPMDEVVAHARKIALPGECVLLSSMTSSFDMFKKFEHRGDVFKQIVNGLK